MVGSLLFGQQLLIGISTLLRVGLPPLVPYHLLLALLFTALAYFFQVWAWCRVMWGLGTRIELGEALRFYFLVFLPRYIPGSVWGYISRGEWLAERYGASLAQASFGSILEVGWLLLTAACLIVVQLGSVRQFFLPALLLAVVAGLIGGWLLTSGWRKIGWLHKRFPIEIEVPLSRDSEGRESSNLWLTPSLYLALWLAYGLSLNSILNLFGFGTDSTQNLFIQIGEATGQMALSWSVGFLVFFVPAGLGVRELTLTTMLSSTLSRPDLAEAIAVSTRVVILLVELGWIGFALVRPSKSGSAVEKSRSQAKK